MYATIRSYDRYFAQAARIQNTPVKPAPARKPITEFILTHATSPKTYRFAVLGDDEVLVEQCYGTGRNVRNSWTKTREDARKYWQTLQGMGYERF